MIEHTFIGDWRHVAMPFALTTAVVIAALLRLDQALALGFVKVFDGAEKFHGGVSFFAGVARIGRPAARRR